MQRRSPDSPSGQISQSAFDVFLLGRALAESGDLEQARVLLRRAVDEDRKLSDAWVWLAATTEDPAEQKQDLDWAIAADPANAAARRWLGILNGRLQPKDLLPIGAAGMAPAPGQPETASSVRTFVCRACGGSLRFDPESTHLKCVQCGAREVVVETPSGRGGQVLDYALPTREGHAWAEAQRRQVCQQCGAATIFPPGQTSTFCPFCGATAFMAAPEDARLVRPECTLLMGFEADRAEALLKEWLGRGFFSPDDLMSMASRHVLRPAYLPVWIFDFDMTVHWQGLVERGSGRSREWEWCQDQRSFFYKDQLQPGVRALPLKLFSKVEPFDLSALVEAKPDYVAGWPAATYDVSLADAVVNVHGEAAQAADKQMRLKAAPGKSLRNFLVTGHDFTGETFRLALLPVWLGAYLYGGKVFQVIINGQTGKVAGDKPVDWVKVIAVTVGAFFILLLLAAVALFLLKGIP